jgi:hypothetical protein
VVLQDYTFIVKHVSGKSNATADTLSRQEEEQEIKNKPAMMFREGVMVMGLEMAEEKGNLITWYHSDPLAGHLGVNKTLEKIRREGIDWKGLMEDVTQYIRGCLSCQWTKPQKGPMPGQLAPLQQGGEVPTHDNRGHQIRSHQDSTGSSSARQGLTREGLQ